MLELYQTFITLTKVKSYMETAKLLSVSQPGVSKRIKRIEETYSIKLFKDSSLSLTIEGEKFLNLATSIINSHSEFKKDIEKSTPYRNSVLISSDLAPVFRKVFFEKLLSNYPGSIASNEFEMIFSQKSIFNPLEANINEYNYIFSSKLFDIPDYNRTKLYKDTIHILINKSSYINFTNSLESTKTVTINSIFSSKKSLIFNQMNNLFKFKHLTFYNDLEYILSLINDYDFGCTFLPSATYTKLISSKYPNICSIQLATKVELPVYLYYKPGIDSSKFFSWVNKSLHNYFDK